MSFKKFNALYSASKISFLVIVFVLLCSQTVFFSQTAIPNTTTVSQNFNSMNAGTTTPANWKIQQNASPTWAGATSALTAQASSGTPATGGTYNWGTSAATDRALGAMTSGTVNSPHSVIGWYRNTNTANLTQLSVSYNLERYRINTAAASVQFYYSTNGTAWTAVTAGDIAAATIGTGTSAYSFAPQATFSVGSFNITGLNVPVNGDIYLCFRLNTTGSNSQGIGIDDVAVTASFGPACVADPEPTVESSAIIVTPSCNGADISFTRGNGNKVLIVMSSDCTITNPTDQSNYSASSVYNSVNITAAGDFVMYNGTGNSVNITGLTQNTSYCFKIYEYNVTTTSCTENYLNPVTSTSFTTTSGCILFTESFDEVANATSGVDNTGGVAWSTSCAGCPAGVDGSAGFARVSGGLLDNEDTNGPAEFLTGTINSSTCTDGLYIKFNITELGDMEGCPDAGGGCNSTDWVVLNYDIDGTGWQSPANSSNCNAPSCSNTNVIKSGNGNLNYNTGCIPAGNDIKFRIVTQTWASDEHWNIDNIEVGCTTCILLPITLTYFEATCTEQNILYFSWETASEIDNEYFTIEKTIDGLNFEEVARIQGAGNSIVTKQYQHQVKDSDINAYFRLKQTDYNANTSYSKLISPSCTEGSELKVYPNPSNGTFIVNGYPKNAQLIVLNDLGQQIIAKEADSYSSHLDLSRYSDGIYFLKVLSDSQSQTIKLILNK